MRSERDPKYIYAQEHKLYFYYVLSVWRALRKQKLKKKKDSKTV